MKMISYDKNHLIKLRSCEFIPQGPFGEPPAIWALKIGLANISWLAQLPKTILNRKQVLDICSDPTCPLLFGYVCGMAWGAQGRGPGGLRSARAAWSSRTKIEELLFALRQGRLGRREAYEFVASAGIQGLGPSYATKLIYFFSPRNSEWAKKPAYIMDQWTSKSVNLLTGEGIVRMAQSWPTSLNTGLNYEVFCQVVDDLAGQFGISGDQMEQRLFSEGSLIKAGRRIPRREWRAYVSSLWTSQRPKGRSSVERLQLMISTTDA